MFFRNRRCTECRQELKPQNSDEFCDALCRETYYCPFSAEAREIGNWIEPIGGTRAFGMPLTRID